MIVAEFYKITAAERRANVGCTGKVKIVALDPTNSLGRGTREVGYTTYVEGKNEARKIAAMYRAQPWNF